MSLIQVANVHFDASGTSRIEKLANGQMRIVGNTVAVLANNIVVSNSTSNVALSNDTIRLSGLTRINGNAVFSQYPVINYTDYDKGFLAANTGYTNTHSFGANADFRKFQAYWRFRAASNGWAIGDVLYFTDLRDEMVRWCNSTHIGVCTGISTSIRSKTANTSFNPFGSNVANLILRVYN